MAQETTAKPEQAPAEANGPAASHGSLGKLITSSSDGPMATGRGGNQGKTAFVTEHLRQNAQATDKVRNEAESLDTIANRLRVMLG